MRTLLIAVGLFLTASILMAGANSFKYPVNGAWVSGDYRGMYIDTVTLHARSGIKTVAFPKDVYNLKIWSTNAATDSAGVKIWWPNLKGLWHTDSACQQNFGQIVGANSDDDTIFFYFPLGGFKYQVIVYGTADSTCTIKLIGETMR